MAPGENEFDTPGVGVRERSMSEKAEVKVKPGGAYRTQ